MSKEQDFLEAQMLYQKQIADLEAKLAEKDNALKLAREYMFKVMCADDVPSEEWFIKCAKENKNE